MKSRTVMALLALTAAACASATAPKDLSFERTRNAMVIIAAPTGQPVTQNLDEFRKVDLAKNEFVPGYLRLESQGYQFNEKANEINADSPYRSFILAAYEVPAGDYARQQSQRMLGTDVQGHVGRVCLSAFSPVYSLAPGEIAIIRVDEFALASTSQWRSPANAPSNAAIMEEFKRSQPKFPGIAGEASLKQPTAFIRWESNGRQCLVPKVFERIDPKSIR